MSNTKYIAGLIQNGELHRIVGKAFSYNDFTQAQLDALKGEPGNGIESIVQTASSDEDEGINTWTITYTNGSTTNISVRNGSSGSGIVREILVNGETVLDNGVASILLPTMNVENEVLTISNV